MPNNPSTPASNVPNPSILPHQADVSGILHGFDRLRLQGTLRYLYQPTVMECYLPQAKVLWKDFKQFAAGLTHRIRQSAEQQAQAAHRPVIYLRSSRRSKEDLAREIAARDHIHSGLIAVFSAVEPCRTYFVRGNRATQRLELKLQSGKCIHLYFYQMHPVLGFLHLRLQTWFPFLIQICLNGREWLARQMDALGLRYRRANNSLPWIEDVAKAQALLDQQWRTDSTQQCNQRRAQCHPLHAEIARPLPLASKLLIPWNQDEPGISYISRKSVPGNFVSVAVNSAAR